MNKIQRFLLPRTMIDLLYWLSIVLLIVLFGTIKVALQFLDAHNWHRFGDIILLFVLALIVSSITWHIQRRVRRAMEEAERRRIEAQALAAENEAVVRVARTVVREFAQPLSGTLSYSALLMMRAATLGEDERREIEGLRQGVLQMERLLTMLRQAVDTLSPCNAAHHVVDDVERSVMPHRTY